MATIKAIETQYAGCHFRSRIEARWAVFFDTLNIPWEYEKEGFDLEGTWYLPDFWLPEQQCWIEIKGQEPTQEEHEKAVQLSNYTKKHIYVFFGDVWLPSQIDQGGAYSGFSGGYCLQQQFYWVECPFCHRFNITYHGSIVDLPCYCPFRKIEIVTQATMNFISQFYTDRERRAHEILAILYKSPDASLHTHPEEELAWLGNNKESQKLISELDQYKTEWKFIERIRLDTAIGHRTMILSRRYDATPHLIEAYTAARSARFEYSRKRRK